MIVVRMFEGLGNQLFQYAMGRSLAERNGVPLRLDTSWFDGDQSGKARLSPRREWGLGAFHIEAERATVRDMAYCVGSKRILPRVRDKILRRGHKMWPKVRDNFRRYNRAAAHAGPDTYLDGYWQSPKYFEHIAPMLRREFTLRDCPAVRQAEAAEQSFRSAGIPLVSVHVRRGDLVPVEHNGVLRTNHGPPTSVQYIHAAMEQFQEPVRFVVVADPGDRQWCRQNVVGPNVVSFDGSGLIADFSLMGRCDHHIIANSTFSWWAAWVDGKPHKRVIAPEDWFWPNDPAGRTSRDVLPQDWTAIMPVTDASRSPEPMLVC